MTWKHIALVALAILLVLGCGINHVCSANEHTFGAVLQLATTIVAGAVGHAHGAKTSE